MTNEIIAKALSLDMQNTRVRSGHPRELKSAVKQHTTCYEDKRQFRLNGTIVFALTR